MAITDWPENERPREKLLQRGAAALSDAELLAVLLRTGVRGCSAVDLGRNLLNEAGDLRALLELPPERMRRMRGLGGTRLTQLLAALEISKRYMALEKKRAITLSEPEPAARMFMSELRGEPSEVFAVLFMDNKNRMLGFEKLFRGTVDAAAVYPREVVRRALDHNASSIIVGHNHPSGIAEPSRADRDVTRRLSDALNLVDVRLLDHLVIGDNQWESLGRLGWL
ncbi:DNA repair protein RadC [Alloalcanivorax xenomutans]|uniref:RadC family protein n=1 Tax=Alloalcanivorax xenomutans TaxID=1094342 RepID=UPI00293414C1|nr:DNA repair protein RadC [Alloalcanivorax xenomutans]WOD28629.1 DNA repair protein RadC [Alloalcanivorax xenomutans]